MAIDVNAVARALNSFIQTHQTRFQRLSGRLSQLLEIGALTIAAKHYELSGYSVEAANLVGNEFRVKLSTRGAPWNFSWFAASRGATSLEIHSNLPVEDALATRGARYVVDVAVINAGTLPTDTTDRRRWFALGNDDLVTFIEAKALVVYPMLIAQFIGIVHELKPDFLLGNRPTGFGHRRHFDPALVSLGYLHGTCLHIVRGFRGRRCFVRIVPEFDAAIARIHFGGSQSPLAR
jgi:hypothetical protein